MDDSAPRVPSAAALLCGGGVAVGQSQAPRSVELEPEQLEKLVFGVLRKAFRMQRENLEGVYAEKGTGGEKAGAVVAFLRLRQPRGPYTYRKADGSPLSDAELLVGYSELALTYGMEQAIVRAALEFETTRNAIIKRLNRARSNLARDGAGHLDERGRDLGEIAACTPIPRQTDDGRNVLVKLSAPRQTEAFREYTVASFRIWKRRQRLRPPPSLVGG